MIKNIYTLVLPLALLAFKVNAQTVTLDYYFNHETHKNSKGEPERFHYLWEETDNNGYFILGENLSLRGLHSVRLKARLHQQT